MISFTWIGGKIVTAVSLSVTKVCLFRPLSVTVCSQKMAEPTSPPAGSFKLNPLKSKPAFRKDGDHVPNPVTDITHKPTVETCVRHSGAEMEVVTSDIIRDVEMKDVSEVPTKLTVLPKDLLKEVTQFVKKQAVTVPSTTDVRMESGSIENSEMEIYSDTVLVSAVQDTVSDTHVCKGGSCSKELEESGISPEEPVSCVIDPKLQENISLTEAISESVSTAANTKSDTVSVLEAKTEVITVTEAKAESVTLTEVKTVAVRTLGAVSETTELSGAKLDDSAVTEEFLVKTEEDKGEVGASDENMTDPFSGLELDKDAKKTVAYDETHVLPDLAALFSGELEKRRRKLLKKAKLKAWKKERGKKRKNQKHVDKESGSDNEKAEEEQKKPRKPSVNYFVAVQISSPQIQAALKKVQEEVVSVCKELSPAINRPATFHLTMCVLSLNSDDDMLRSKLALDEAQRKLQPLFTSSPLYLDIVGLGHFRNEVVFANVKPEDQVRQLQHIAEVLEESFLEQEIVSPDKKGFKPHLTIMKLSFLKGRKRKGLKKIDGTLYKDHVDAEFGRQEADTLQLCAMLKKKQESGYYHVDHAVRFASASLDNKEEVTVKEATDQSLAGAQEQVRNTDTGFICQDDEIDKDGTEAGQDTSNAVCEHVIDKNSDEKLNVDGHVVNGSNDELKNSSVLGNKSKDNGKYTVLFSQTNENDKLDLEHLNDSAAEIDSEISIEDGDSVSGYKVGKTAKCDTAISETLSNDAVDRMSTENIVAKDNEISDKISSDTFKCDTVSVVRESSQQKESITNVYTSTDIVTDLSEADKEKAVNLVKEESDGKR